MFQFNSSLFLDAEYSIFFPPVSPQACLSSLELPPPEGVSPCSNPKTVKMRGGGGEGVVQRIAAPLDVWMLKWNLLFMNLFTVVPVVKENVSFFCFLFLFFLRCPEYLWLSKKHFTCSAAGSRDWVQDGGLEKFPAVCRFVPHTVQRFPTLV